MLRAEETVLRTLGRVAAGGRETPEMEIRDIWSPPFVIETRRPTAGRMFRMLYNLGIYTPDLVSHRHKFHLLSLILYHFLIL